MLLTRRFGLDLGDKIALCFADGNCDPALMPRQPVLDMSKALRPISADYQLNGTDHGIRESRESLAAESAVCQVVFK